MVLLTSLSGPATVSCLSLSSKLFACGFENGSIHLTSPNNYASPTILSPSSRPCTAIALAGDDSDILYSSHNGNIAFWDIRKHQTPLNVCKVSNDDINCIDVNAGDGCLATADDVGMVSLISSLTGEVMCVLNNHDNICSAAKFRPTRQNQLISCGMDCRLVVCDWKSGDRERIVIEMTKLVDPCNYFRLLRSCVNEGKTYHRRRGRNGEDVFSVRIASSFTPEEVEQMVKTRAYSQSLLLNPPMIHSLGCDDSGKYVAVGLGNGAVEIFKDDKNFRHVESLLGHRRSVSALLPVGSSHLLSGGDDCCLFLWEMSRNGTGQRFVHSEKIGALAGRELGRVFVADNTSDVKVMDLVRA
ncbi:unnamed protein product [Hydatigera taeniaeformis]|uniref:WD_REPEATS_REGION domain-containing protein n=1 Tax=Hydatigena taeniaeformis TaxID=6205 RepID=A0A0R3X0C2_HYDTA|nr:unnamed protein product [Hydatigera taeniaeformis]